MRYDKPSKCWMCNKIIETTEHHIIPKILRRLVPELNKHTVPLCVHCHAKVHILLPRFFSDGSYKWKGSKDWNVMRPEWKDWSRNEIVDWDGEKK